MRSEVERIHDEIIVAKTRLVRRTELRKLRGKSMRAYPYCMYDLMEEYKREREKMWAKLLFGGGS